MTEPWIDRVGMVGFHLSEAIRRRLRLSSRAELLNSVMTPEQKLNVMGQAWSDVTLPPLVVIAVAGLFGALTSGSLTTLRAVVFWVLAGTGIFTLAVAGFANALMESAARRERRRRRKAS